MTIGDGSLDDFFANASVEEREAMDKATKRQMEMMESSDMLGLPLNPTPLALRDFSEDARIYMASVGSAMFGHLTGGEMSEKEALVMVSELMMSLYSLGHAYGMNTMINIFCDGDEDMEAKIGLGVALEQLSVIVGK